MSVEIGWLVVLAHPYVHVGERGELTVEYLVCSFDNKATCKQRTPLRWPKTVCAIAEYLAVRGSGRPTHKAVRE